MTEDPKLPRKANGQFARGQSGNSKGRPKRSNRITHPEEFRNSVFSVSEFKVDMKVDGMSHKLTVLQANMLALGLKGANGDIHAAERYLKAHFEAQAREERDMREGTKRLLRGEPEYMAMRHDDPNRKKAEQRFTYALNAVSGRRERLVSRLRRKPKAKQKT